MNRSFRAIVWCGAIVALIRIPLAAQVATYALTARQVWTPSRTPGGQPDLQGVWSNNTVTPFERPAALNGKEFLSDEELAALKRRAAQLFGGVGDIAPGDELFLALLSNEQEHKSPRAVGDYNQVWDADELVFEHRTSQVIDPANGLLPPLTLEGAQKQASVREARRLHPADGPESRTLLERCISNGAIRLGFVQTRYSSYYQIVQTPEYVLLQNEVLHETRIVRLDGRPHPPAAIQPWLGDSRGHWDGDTLVIDTTNFHPRSTFRPSVSALFVVEHFHMIERLRQLDAETMEYRLTVDDPTTWGRPWTALTTWKRSANRLYEFACHEANYAMEGILRGARADEASAAAKKPPQ
jgi:hypothetical protein